MATDSAQHLQATSQASTGLLARGAEQVRQFICGLHGHDSLLHFEQGRISLLCASCGHESPGWEVKNRLKAPRPKARVLQISLVRKQRIA